jgi:nucleotide-binding universal stress UspA family protein
MFSTEWAGQQTAGTLAPPPSTRYLSVIGFDGTAHALRALDAAVTHLHGREGSIELVYIADPPANTRHVSDEVRNHLLNLEPRWHFQRRDGDSVPDELIAAADELHQEHEAHIEIDIVVGSSTDHGHRVAVALIQRHRYPVLVVP